MSDQNGILPEEAKREGVLNRHRGFGGLGGLERDRDETWVDFWTGEPGSTRQQRGHRRICVIARPLDRSARFADREGMPIGAAQTSARTPPDQQPPAVMPTVRIPIERSIENIESSVVSSPSTYALTRRLSRDEYPSSPLMPSTPMASSDNNERQSLLPRSEYGDTPPRARSHSHNDDGASGVKEPLTKAAVLAMLGSSANLMATSMGTGMLALPIAVYYSGAVTGTVLIIAMAVLSDISLVFLVKAAKESGTKSLQELGRYYYGPQGELIVNVSLVALLLCASLSVLIAIAELLTPIWRHALQTEDYDHWYCREWFVMLLCVAIIYPISIPSNLSPLKWSSSGAVISIFLVFIFMGIRFCQHGVTKDSKIDLFVDSPIATLALPIQGLAYASQFNVVGLYVELEEHKKHINTVIHCSMVFTCIIYACFGLLGYLYFGQATGKYSMILDGFHNDKLMLIAGAMISLTNILKMPLIILPFRSTVNLILFNKQDFGLAVSAIETVFLLGAIYVLARLVGDLALGLELSGPTVGVFVCFILPAMLCYKADKEKWSKRLIASYREDHFTRTQITALVVALLGVLMGLASIAGLVFHETGGNK